MSLAARCPACGTVFRVVQDQLRVSEGWVRCGRCAEVFNAIESLVDLDALPPSRAPARSATNERVVDDLERLWRQDQRPSADHTDDDASDHREPGSRGESARMPERFRESRLPAIEDFIAPVAAAPSTETAVASTVDIPTDSVDPPTFVRRAERAARWRRPGVRAALAVLGVVAALTLLVQAGLEYRHIAAARWPSLRPLLAQACAWAGCSIEAPRLIEALAVESSGLVRIEGTALYRLSVVLRSRSPLALAVPALDLTLTDSQGSVMARRVILPQELGLQRPSVTGMSELPLQATLSATERPISGYTIEIFYP